MEPVSPVMPHLPDAPETIIAKDQKPYRPLAVYRANEYALSRWRMSWKERLCVLWTGNVYLWVMTDWRKPFPPVMLQTEEPGTSLRIE